MNIAIKEIEKVPAPYSTLIALANNHKNSKGEYQRL
jgi:hypothetical protein